MQDLRHHQQQQQPLLPSKSSSSSVAPKTLTIKLASRPAVPPNFFADTWVKLHSAVLAVFAKRPGDFSKEELYSMVRGSCACAFAGVVLYAVRFFEFCFGLTHFDAH